MKKIALHLTLISTILLSGCASILNDKTQAVNVSSSNGKDIEGSIDGINFKGPGVVNVSRENKDKILLTTTDGCVKETAMTKSVDSKFFINILSGGVFGSSTDYGTKKMWRYSDNVVVSCK